MMWFARLFGFLFLAAVASGLPAQSGHRIEVQAEGFEGQEIYLAYYFGDKQYIRDTTARNPQGTFVFEGEEALEPGMYLVVFPPDNRFFQVLVQEGEQHFRVHTQYENPSENIRFEGSPDNSLFYTYLAFLAEKRPQAEALKKEMEGLEEGDKKRQKLQHRLEALDEEVRAYQQRIIEEHPNSFTAAIIRANLPLEPPEFEGTEEEVHLKRWRWSLQHYFDNLDLSDPRMLRTPFLFQRVQQYVEKMVVQHPDTISQALDRILEAMRPAPETFKFYLIHFLNEYAKSKVVGFDAVYVHLALNYYAKGDAPWTDPDQLEKIIDNAKKLEPLLIGKIAPDIEMTTRDGRRIRLHEFQSPYTVLFFWDPDCGHCKKSMPKMLEFYEQFKDRGVEVFAVCTKLVKRTEDGKWSMEEVQKCWDFIDEKKTGVWLNTVDPYHRSRYKSIYDIRSTPQIYVLDKDKKILSKRIGAEQLPEVMELILKAAEEEQGTNGKS